MMISAALVLLSFAQVIPDKASAIYTGVPIASAPSIKMEQHNASATLTKTNETLESLTVLKNTGDSPVTITVTLPVRGHNVDWSMADNMSLTATLDNSPLTLQTKGSRITPPSDQKRIASGVKAETYGNYFTASLSFIPHQTHALQVKFSGALGHAGLDGTQRVVAYDTSGAGSWNGPVGQLNFALHYDTRIVFQVFAALPEHAWQIGPNGAFIKQTDVKPTEGSKLLFTFYPGGYDKIGG